MENENKKRILFLILPEVHLLDLAGAAQVFYTAHRMGANYEIIFCANQPEQRSAQGLMFAQLSPLEKVAKTDFIIIPGISSEGKTINDIFLDTPTLNWLKTAYSSGCQIASVCTGAFALGETGLLDGRRCTTHWSMINYLQVRHPKAKVVDNVLFIHDQNVTTSAGVASGIDMALSFLEQAHGAMFTAKVARQLVVYMRRNGNQPQQSIYLQYRTHLNPSVHQAQDFIINHLSDRLSLDEIADVSHLSVRSLSRVFKQATGLTAVQYQQRLRLELANNLMGNPKLSLDQIAAKCGFEDARHFRRLWQTHFGTSPSISRKELVNSTAEFY